MRTGRKLVSLLASAACLWAWVSPAAATIDNSVTATGTALGQPITATATESVDVVNQVATLLVDKQGVLNDGGDGNADVGDTISYTFDITNTGNVTLTNVVLADPLLTPTTPVLDLDVAPLGDSPDTAAAGWAVLAPGDRLHATATYTLTQADLDAGRVINTATATAATVPGLPVTGTDTVDTRFNIVSGLTLAKTGTLDLGPNGQADVGDLITYQFTVTNTGTATLSNVKVSDPLVDFAALPGHERVIALMEGAATGVDTMATASIDPVSAPASAGRPYEWYPQAQAAPVDVPQLPAAIHAERRLVNMSGRDGALAAGDRVGIYFDLYNTGEVPLTGITVSQPGADAFGDKLDILAPNTRDSASIIFTHELTAEDVARGTLDMPASITARARGRSIVAQADQALPLQGAAALAELATAAVTPLNVATLAPGASTTFTATYPLTQADIDAGHVPNTATATATNPFNEPVSATDSFDTPVPVVPAIALVKTSSLNLGADGVASVGDVITYQITATNRGNITLNNVTVTDPLPGIVLTAAPFSLAPAASNTVTATYALTQADVDAGRVQNQATVTANPAGGGAPVTDQSDESDVAGNDPTVTTLPAAPRIALVKKITNVTDTNGNGMNDVGDVVHYNFTVTNVGNVTLTNVYVQDRNPAVVTTPAPPTAVSLAPGAVDTSTFTAAYTLTQADADRGFFDNTADVHGRAPDGSDVTDESDPLVNISNGPTHLVIPALPRIALIKTVGTINDVNGNGITDLNDIITYNFAVSNVGNVTLTNVTVTDPNATVTGGPISLLPGQTNVATFHATHQVTAVDMLNGRVTNQATATGRSPANVLVSDLSDNANPNGNAPTVTPVTVLPGIAVIKRVVGFTNTNGNGVVDAGDSIQYEFSVTNTGNVPLTNVRITDPLVLVTGGPVSTLNPGVTDTTTFRASYVMTAADITAGQVTNQATGLGTAPSGTVVSDLSDDNSNTENQPTVALISNAPAIGLMKTVSGVTDTNGNGINDAGDVIRYAFTVTNLGNVALTNVTITDANATVTGGPLATLPVGGVDNATFTASHVVTVADMNAGQVSNQALVSASSTMGAVTDLSDDNNAVGSDPTVSPLNQLPGIALVKTMSAVTDVNHNGRTDTGDIVNYAFTVTNTGNVTLTNITVTDANAVVTGGPLATLGPGLSDTTTFTARHVVTIADSEAEQIINQAQVQGTAPGGAALTDLSDDDSVTGNDPTVTAVSAPLPVLTKTAARSEVRRGERVAYTITAASLRRGPYDIADIMPPGFTFVAGSATVNGVAVVPAMSGNTLSWPAIAPDAQGTITIKLSLLASTTLSTGDFINRARLYLTANGDLLAEASAKVTIKEEHVFDCGEIIGRVFDDLNGNGYADEGEPGLPGVRVVTVKGLLVTTDKFGRFHVSCADVPDGTIGSNFLMKLDVRTLPAGYALTTENPRDVRLTRGKITKLNFGVSRHHDVELALTRDAFNGNTAGLKPKYAAGIDRLIALLGKGKGALTIVYRCGQEAPIIQTRLDAVQEIVRARWAQEGHDKPLKITTRVECGK